MNFKLNFSGVSLREKTVFVKNLSIMLTSGLTISESFEILKEQASGPMRKTLEEILKMIVAGESLAASFASFPKVFSSFVIHSVAAGETSGNLEVNLKNIGEQMGKEQELRAKIKSAMIYPIIVIILGLGIALGVSFFVLPKITPLFMGLKVDLPFTTRLLIWFSDFMKKYGVFFIVFLAVLAGFISWLFKTKFIKPYTHYLFFRLPVIKDLTVNKNMASFCQNMGLLLASGLNIDECLKISSDTLDNFYYKKALERIRQQVSEGSRLADSFGNQASFFPALIVGMVGVGEKSGNLEKQFLNLAGIYQAEVDNAVKNLSAVLEPALLVIIGLAVGGLAISIITPIYKITGNVYR